MIDWRVALYPLGLLAAIPFSGRFVIQWLESERQGRSHVTPLFWILSLVGNGMLCLHATIQLQYPVAVVQIINALIAWRNLNIMQPPEKRCTLRFVTVLLGLSVAFVTSLFALQSLWGPIQLMRSPSFLWEGTPLSFTWHLIGMSGIALFTSRFWVQWWLAERRQKSSLTRTFWWLSLLGALLSSAYFYQMGDIANLIGPTVGILTYSRNLWLLFRTPAGVSAT